MAQPLNRTPPEQRSSQDSEVFGHYIDRDAAHIPITDETDETPSRFEPIGYDTIFDSKTMLETPRGSFCTYEAGQGDLTFVCLHGAQHAALSWAAVTQHLKSKYRIFAFDYRGHGETICEDEHSLSKDNLVNDIVTVVETRFGVDDPPPIVLVGHSLGGALAVHVATSRQLSSVVGIVVIDVVEGTAKAALVHMHSIVGRRPRAFPDLPAAIRWVYSSRMIRNVASARISVPPMFRRNEESGEFEWRTDVLRSEPYWLEWFEGLSADFLKAPCAKMLMIADTDRLDKPLTIGQMQGKYQLQVMGIGVGHTVHEDTPNRVAEFLDAYAQRNQFVKMYELNKKLRK